MRKILLAHCLLLFFAIQLTAQVKADKRSIRQATEAQVQLYQLSEEQAEQMAVIQENRLTNLAAIEALRQSDYKRYLLKLQSIRKYTEQATHRMLTARQLDVFEQQQQKKTEAREQVLRELKRGSAAPEERDLALLRLEEEWQ